MSDVFRGFLTPQPPPNQILPYFNSYPYFMTCHFGLQTRPPRQPRQLPWLIFETLLYCYFSTKQKTPWIFHDYLTKNREMWGPPVLGLLCRIEEINIFIILPRIKNSLTILGLLWRFEETFFFYPAKKTP